MLTLNLRDSTQTESTDSINWAGPVQAVQSGEGQWRHGEGHSGAKVAIAVPPNGSTNSSYMIKQAYKKWVLIIEYIVHYNLYI